MPRTVAPIANPPTLDRSFWVAAVIATLLLIPRGLLITAAHSPTQDEQTHLRMGIADLTGNPSGMPMIYADAPLGDAICALPMFATGSLPAKPMNPATLSPHPLASEDPASVTRFATPELMTRLRAARRDVLFGHSLPPDTLRLIISAWKSLLFVPAALLVFHWTRWLYRDRAAFLALALLLIDPTLAADVPLATIDTLAVEGVLFSCFFTWRLMQRPDSKPLLFAAATFSAATLLLKLNTLILPAVTFAAAIAFAIHRDRLVVPALRRRAHLLCSGTLLTCFMIWVVTRFDLSSPGQWLPGPAKSPDFSLYGSLLYPAFQSRWPAGHFLQALCTGLDINASMRFAFLLGRSNHGGWWYYFPVLASYKIPLGYFVVFAAALLSLRRTRPRFDEWSLAIPFLGWSVMLLFFTHINTGFRHFLPAYVFLLMLAARALVVPRLQPLLWLAVAASLAHTLTYHPDYLSYFNRPLEKPWAVANDSNVDWGQGLKEVSRWLDAHPTTRPVYLRYDWDPVWPDYYLPGRVQRLKLFQPPPTTGLLIISPVWESGYWDPTDAYAFLRPAHPLATIGHSMPVYDLDAVTPRPSPATFSP